MRTSISDAKLILNELCDLILITLYATCADCHKGEYSEKEYATKNRFIVLLMIVVILFADIKRCETLNTIEVIAKNPHSLRQWRLECKER